MFCLLFSHEAQADLLLSELINSVINISINMLCLGIPIGDLFSSCLFCLQVFVNIAGKILF